MHGPSFLILAYFSSNLLASFSAILYRYEPSCIARGEATHRYRQRAWRGEPEEKEEEGQAGNGLRGISNIAATRRGHLVVVLAVVPHQPHVVRHLLVLRVVPPLEPRLAVGVGSRREVRCMLM